MHDGIYENQERLSLPLLFELAELLGLPQEGLRDAIADHEFLPRIRKDLQGGVRSGVNGTPTFFINGVRHDGQMNLKTWFRPSTLTCCGQKRVWHNAAGLMFSRIHSESGIGVVRCWGVTP